MKFWFSREKAQKINHGLARIFTDFVSRRGVHAAVISRYKYLRIPASRPPGEKNAHRQRRISG